MSFICITWKFVPVDDTSLLVETDSSIRKALSLPCHLQLYPDLLEEVETGDEALGRGHFVLECSRSRFETSDREELIDAVGGVSAGVVGGAESEGFTLEVTLRSASLLPASDSEAVIDTSGMPICNIYISDNLWSLFI